MSLFLVKFTLLLICNTILSNSFFLEIHFNNQKFIKRYFKFYVAYLYRI